MYSMETYFFKYQEMSQNIQQTKLKLSAILPKIFVAFTAKDPNINRYASQCLVVVLRDCYGTCPRKIISNCIACSNSVSIQFMSFVSSIVVEATICKSIIHQKAQVRLGLFGSCKDRNGQANASSSLWCLRMIS
ncbi:hypothetical protein BD560DRAFT_426214 [Blakeslea trispora]|nr:hypothetical protein BD560DRAFT_426214 [Blakeslea trispora]